MKNFLIHHSLDGQSDWTFCEDYKDMTGLIEINRMLYGNRYKVLNAIKIGVIEQFNHLMDQAEKEI